MRAPLWARVPIAVIAGLLFTFSLWANNKDCAQCTAREVKASPPLGSLNWGRYSEADLRALLKNDSKSEVARELKNILRHAEEDLSLAPDLTVVESIDRQGVSPKDPKFQRAEQAISDESKLLGFALCARVGEGELQKKCEAAAKKNVLKWVGTYRPAGKPLDDAELMHVFLSIDLTLHRFSEDEKKGIRSWLQSFITAGDKVYHELPSNHGARIDNFNTYRLSVRAVIGQILGSEAIRKENARLIQAHLTENLLPPKDAKAAAVHVWMPDPECANLRSVKDYGGFDFR